MAKVKVKKKHYVCGRECGGSDDLSGIAIPHG
jgi:hypothetical protein